MTGRRGIGGLGAIIAGVVAVVISSTGFAGDGTPAAPAAAPVDTEQQAADLARELRGIEQDVTSLKERVFRSKATLQLLKELVLEGAGAGARLVLWHENKMGAAYSLESVQYFLDGKSVYTRADGQGGLDQERRIKLLDQALPPGSHNLQVTMLLRGSGFGVFSYLETYSFKVQSSYSFAIEDGKTTTLRVMADERGGPLTPFVDRPYVDYKENSEGAGPASEEAAPGAATP